MCIRDRYFTRLDSINFDDILDFLKLKRIPLKHHHKNKSKKIDDKWKNYLHYEIFYKRRILLTDEFNKDLEKVMKITGINMEDWIE